MTVSPLRRATVALLLLCATAPASAQQTVSPADPGRATPGNRDQRRLFQRFIEDSAIIDGGWIEGQFGYANLPEGASRWSLGALLAFQVNEQIEAGLQFGYRRMEADDGPDGTGLGDIDLYAKYRFHGSADRCAVGGLIKAPVADEDEGLGTGRMDVEGFFACRADLSAVTLAGNVGARYNGDPDPPLPEAHATVLLGGALLLPVGTQSSFVIEATYESERLDGTDADARLTLGFQGVTRRPGFGLRGAVGLPLSDGAPDYQILFGAVYLY